MVDYRVWGTDYVHGERGQDYRCKTLKEALKKAVSLSDTHKAGKISIYDNGLIHEVGQVHRIQVNWTWIGNGRNGYASDYRKSPFKYIYVNKDGVFEITKAGSIKRK